MLLRLDSAYLDYSRSCYLTGFPDFDAPTPSRQQTSSLQEGALVLSNFSYQTDLFYASQSCDLFSGSQEIEALVTCHSEHAVAKFLGKCNQQKWDLDACFRREKALKR